MDQRVCSGTYADFKIVKTRNVAQVIIEIPLEQGNDFVTRFGLPDPHIEKWVAIALMKANTIQHDPSASSAIQAAGILCKEPKFGEFLRDQIGLPEVRPDQEPSIVDGLRTILGIKSRTEMHENSEAVKAFNRIKGEYDSWRMS